jgi:hypothetical protein
VVAAAATGCSGPPPTVLPAPPVESTVEPGPGASRGAHAEVGEAEVVALVTSLNEALASGDVEQWLSHLDLDAEGMEQQRHWFAAVQDVPMEVRELVATGLLGDDPERGQGVQVAFRHQVTGADPVPSLEYYRWTLHRAGPDAPVRIVELRGKEGYSAAYPQLWDLSEVRVHVSDSLVLLVDPERWPEVEGLVPALEEAARETLDTFPVEDVQRLVVTLGGYEQLEELFGSSAAVVDYAGFTSVTSASSEADPGTVGDPADPLAVAGRVVLELEYATAELDYFGRDLAGGSPLLRHEGVHLSMLLAHGGLHGPAWGVEGLATWWEMQADPAVREDLDLWSLTIAEEAGLAPAWPPAGPDDFYPEDVDRLDRHYADAGLVFAYLEERWGGEAALDVGRDLHTQEGVRTTAHVEEVLREHTGLSTDDLRAEWEQWVQETTPAD